MTKQQYIEKLNIYDSSITWIVNTIRNDLKYGMTFEESVATFENFSYCENRHQAILEVVKLRLTKLNLIK
jgi:hypothetical protein